MTKIEIDLDKLTTKIEEILYKNYEEIKIKKDENLRKLEKIKNIFCVDEAIIDNLKKSIKTDTTTNEMINLISKQESKKASELNNKIYNKLEEINNIDTTDEDSNKRIEKLSDDLLKIIPQQNKNELSKYVARRKIILELFSKMLEGSMNIKNKEEKEQKILEKHFHNLLLKQHTENDEDTSNLWILNEEFIYFYGYSEKKLSDIEFNNKKVFVDNIDTLQQVYIPNLKLEERPDILLFPEENKCIIIELKSADAHISHYLDQTTHYAKLLANFTSDGFKIEKFYTYLIGENIEELKIPDRFIKSYNSNFYYYPSENIKKYKTDLIIASIYQEITSYSEILLRAITRNKIFINKLGLK